MIADPEPHTEYQESGLSWLGQVSWSKGLGRRGGLGRAAWVRSGVLLLLLGALAVGCTDDGAPDCRAAGPACPLGETCQAVSAERWACAAAVRPDAGPPGLGDCFDRPLGGPCPEICAMARLCVPEEAPPAGSFEVCLTTADCAEGLACADDGIRLVCLSPCAVEEPEGPEPSVCGAGLRCRGGHCIRNRSRRPEPGGTGYHVVIIDDVSNEITADGLPGVDICGVQANCGGTIVAPFTAELAAGDGFICGEGEPPEAITCDADRNDAEAALDFGACDARSNPSDYVSLGGGGSLVVQFSQDLQGCVLRILEATGDRADDESAQVAVCSDASGNDCLTINGSALLGHVSEGDNPTTVAVPTL